MQASQQGPWRIDGLNDRLIELRKARRSFGIIARELSQEFGVALTSNSCIGRAHRLGLDTHECAIITLCKPPARPFRHISRSTPPTPVDRALPIDRNRLVSLFDLQLQHCRFPIGESPNLMFCGLPRLDDGCPYCAAHWRLTHTVARDGS
jgi:hypothetical protein